MDTQKSGGSRRRWLRVVLLATGGLGLGVAALGGPSQPAPVAAVATTTVVVSSRALAEATTLSAADVHPVRVPLSAVTTALSRDLGSVLGRRLRLPVPAGTPLAPALVGMPSAAPAAGRLVTLTVPGDLLSLPLSVGEDVDVVAALPASAGAPGGRVERVGGGRLVSLGPPRRLAAADPGAGGAAMVLACDEAAAMHLLWAESFAHSLTVVARPEGAASLPSVARPGP